MPQEQTAGKAHQHVEVTPPRRFKVIIYNDDVTTMDFVVEVLMKIFLKTSTEAYILMLKAHQEGKAVVGTYSYDTARTRVETTTQEARYQGFPLMVEYQPE